MKKRFNSKPPVKVDDEVEVEVISKGIKGDGVARYENFVVFVPNSVVGGKYKVKIEKVFSKMSFGKIIQEVK